MMGSYSSECEPYFADKQFRVLVNYISYGYDSQYLISQDSFYILTPHYLKTLSVSVGLYAEPAKQVPSADIQHLHSVLCDGSCDMIPIKSLDCTLPMSSE